MANSGHVEWAQHLVPSFDKNARFLSWARAGRGELWRPKPASLGRLGGWDCLRSRRLPEAMRARASWTKYNFRAAPWPKPSWGVAQGSNGSATKTDVIPRTSAARLSSIAALLVSAVVADGVPS